MVLAPLLALLAQPPDGAIVDAALLDGLPRETVRFSTHGRTQECSGPTLRSVLTRLGQPEGASVRGPALTTSIVLEARDGYRIRLSLGEIEPTLGNSPAIVADRCDGEAIGPEDGPVRLIISNEARAARSIRQLFKIYVET